MKLSTRGRYGLKAMIDLAAAYGAGPIPVATLAAQQGISVPYLEQLIAALKKEQLVTSSRGATGGYTVSRPPKDISVGDVLRALEGTTTVVDCVGYESFDCENACSCSARPLWLKLQATINTVLETTTLQDMVDDYTLQKGRLNHEKSLS